MKILFVCSSNVCRSPYCEYMFRRMVENDPNLCGKITVKSSAVFNQMKSIDPKTKKALLKEGFDEAYIDSHKPDFLWKNRAKFDEADVIIGMTKSHRLLLPFKYKHKFMTLSEAAVGRYETIPDPWLVKDMDEYYKAMDRLKTYLETYLSKLEKEL